MKPITIVGGGLAGLALGILLRREEVWVTVFESGRYPRHRVCGEFISGRGITILRALCSKPMGREARTVCFYASRGPRMMMDLPEPALCVSRYELDALLAEEFQKTSGNLQVLEKFEGDFSQEGIVRATGRRRADKVRGHLFGLKGHARGAELAADLEMHFGKNRYVGICGIGDQRVNVCGLFYSKTPMRSGRAEMLEDAVWSGALDGAEWDDDSFCSVAGLSLAPPDALNGFAVGDAATMIPPVTGNGMSMAFESAGLAAGPLYRYAAGKISWAVAQADYAAAWEAEFRGRLNQAEFLQRLLFAPAAQRTLFTMARMWPGWVRRIFAATR